MKILFVSSDIIPHTGGKSTHILSLKEGMNHINVSTDLISLKNLGRNNELFIKILISPVKIISKEKFNYLFKKIWMKKLSKLVYEYCKINKPNYISVQDAMAASALKKVSKNTDIPIIMTMHTYFGIENALDKKKLSNSYFKILKKELFSLQVVNGIIAVDNRICTHILETVENNNVNRLKKENLAVIENFTNVKSYNISSVDEKKKLRERYGFEKNLFIFCCIRRLVEKNGVINAVKAFELIKEKNIILVIAGDGPQRKLISEYIKEKDLSSRVKLMGSLNEEEVKNIYKVSDAAIVPSITVNGLQEATSISALEAMSCGLPTIASDIGGLKQMIESNKTGVLVKEGDINSISKAAFNLFENKEYYEFIKKNARKEVVTNYSHIDAAKKYIRQFQDINNLK